MNKYDSTKDNLAHIKRVNYLLCEIAKTFITRGQEHDTSKLVEPEKSYFDLLTPEYRQLPYGSPEFLEAREKAMPGIKHHWENNTHHPEFWTNGINDMGMIDLLEMLCDWKAASERNEVNSNFKDHLIENFSIFRVSPSMQNLLIKTARSLGFITSIEANHLQ